MSFDDLTVIFIFSRLYVDPTTLGWCNIRYIEWCRYTGQGKGMSNDFAGVPDWQKQKLAALMHEDVVSDACSASESSEKCP